MSSKKKIAVLGLGVHQLDALKYVKKFYFIIGFDEDKLCPGKKYVKKFYHLGLNNKKEIINICKREKVLFAVSFCTEFFLKLSNEINSKINKQSDLKIVKKISNKKICKNEINKSDPSILPKFLLINKKNYKKPIFKKLLPVVIKPIYGSGSKGVTYCKTQKNLIEIFKNNKKLYGKDALVEKYISGIEYAIDGWVYKKEFKFCCLSKKKTSKKPFMLDTSLIINYSNYKLIDLGKALVEKLIKIFNLHNVPVHVEFKINKGIPKLIDFSIRGPGFGVYTNIMRKIMGINTAKIQIDLMRDKKINFKNKKKNLFYLHFLYSQPGKIVKFEGLDQIKDKYSPEIKIFKKIGDISEGYQSGKDRIGQLIVEDKNIHNLKKKIKFIKKNLKIHVK